MMWSFSRYAGKSSTVPENAVMNFPAKEVDEALRISSELGIARFSSCQDEYSLLVRTVEHKLIPTIERHGLGLLPYFPLANGLLTGKYRRNKQPAEGTRLAAWKSIAERYATERNWKNVEGLQKFATERNHSLLELAFSWLLSKPVVSCVIAGATRPEQVEQNVAAVNWSLSPEDLATIDALTC